VEGADGHGPYGRIEARDVAAAGQDADAAFGTFDVGHGVLLVQVKL
jgi:hypothetical protein